MKKLLLSILTCLAVLPLSATNLDELTGSYTGTLNVVLGDGEEGMPMPPTSGVKVFTQKEEGKNTLKLVLKDFSFMNGAIIVGDIEVPDVTVDENGIITAPDIVLDKTQEGLGQLPTSLKGSLTKDKANFVIRVLWNDSPVNVTFDGDKDIEAGINSALEQSVKLIQEGNKITLTGADIKEYSIYNMNGSLVENRAIYTNTIELNHLTYGVYLIKINTGNAIITRKVYKK